MANTSVKTTKSQILKFISQYGDVSIKTISNLTRLSIPHVTHYIEALMAEGYLCEQTHVAATPGRNPRVFSLNPEYGFIAGIDMGVVDRLMIGVFDFAGRLLGQEGIPIKSQPCGEAIVAECVLGLRALIKRHGLEGRRLLSIVIGNPGVVNQQTGAIQAMSNETAKWGHLPLRQIFEKEFGTAAIVLNDVNLCAIGEKEYGTGKGYKNFIFIRNEIGMKAGVIIKNRLYQGELGAAGEIGLNVVLAGQGGPGGCEMRPVESLLSLSAICQDIAGRLPHHPEDPFYSAINGDPEQVNAANIERVLDGDSFVKDIIRDRGALFGYMLINIVTTLDIALIIVSGDIVRFNNYFFKPVRDILARHLPSPPTVLVSSLGDRVALYGAYGVALDHIFRV